VHVDNIKFFFRPTNANNSYKIFKLLKSFEVIIVIPTCFGLHKPSSGSSQSVLRQSYNVNIGYIYRYLKLSVLWLQYAYVILTTLAEANRTNMTNTYWCIQC